MAHSGSNVLFIVNRRAGRSESDSVALIRSCVDMIACDIEITQYAGHAAELAGDAAASGVDLVVAVGGDGTLNEVGRALVGTETAMGIVPAGSGNALARALGIPLDLRDACRDCLTGTARSIDVGRAGTETFLSSAGVGIDAEVCRRFQADPGGRGVFPYIKHTLASIAAYVPIPVRLFLDGAEEAITCRPTVLTIANTPTLGYGTMIAPGADPTDRLLDVCVLEDVSLARTAIHARRLFTGTFDQTPGYTRYRVSRLRIERDGPGPVQVDGEAVGDSETIDVSVVPAGLKVMVPAG